jgi:hypothetical protein
MHARGVAGARARRCVLLLGAVCLLCWPPAAAGEAFALRHGSAVHGCACMGLASLAASCTAPRGSRRGPYAPTHCSRPRTRPCTRPPGHAPSATPPQPPPGAFLEGEPADGPISREEGEARAQAAALLTAAEPLEARLARGEPARAFVTFKPSAVAAAVAAAQAGAAISPAVAAAVAGAAAAPAGEPDQAAAAAAAGAAPREARLRALDGLKVAALSADAPAARDHGVRLEADFDQLPVAVVSLSSSGGLAALLADPTIASVLPVGSKTQALAQSLPLVAQPVAAAASFLGAGCSVAVIDGGERRVRARAPGAGPLTSSRPLRTICPFACAECLGGTSKQGLLRDAMPGIPSARSRAPHHTPPALPAPPILPLTPKALTTPRGTSAPAARPAPRRAAWMWPCPLVPVAPTSQTSTRPTVRGAGLAVAAGRAASHAPAGWPWPRPP